MATVSNLRGSPSFLWEVNKTLGQGATSMVYRGRNKSSGEEVAVKVFTQAGNLRPVDVQMREYTVMQKLQHRNIVSLLAIEEETSARNKIIVMELTDYGSLFNMLEQPQNAYGLPEEEFLIVLEHVAAGMQHLRQSGIAHRDIKPGNILRFKGEDGRSIYKLTDFGAARELDEEEPFMSLYGTEEYLHPDMYERAVLRRPVRTQYTSKVDLWSLGVTFYHVCTGQLPFKAFGGRKNRDKMFQITRGKESGIISGVQHSADGEIEWSRELPDTCKLSLGLKLLVTPLLAGLLETDPDKVWTFDRFFQQVENITQKIVVHVFCPLTWSNLRIYANKTDSYTIFQELIALQTEIPSSDQLLIFDGQLFEHTVQPKLPINNYPKGIREKNPVFCFNRSLGDQELAGFTPASIRDFPKFGNGQVADDYLVAKMSAGLACVIRREVETYSLRQDLVRRAVQLYVHELYHVCSHLSDFFSRLEEVIVSSLRRVKQLKRTLIREQRLLRLVLPSLSPRLFSWLEEIIKDTQSNIQEIDDLSIKISADKLAIAAELDELRNKHLQKKALLKEWDDSVGCIKEDRCADKVDMMLEAVLKIRSHFQEDRKKSLTFNEQQIHKFEKHKLSESCIRIKSLFTDHCEVQAAQQFEQYKAWYRSAHQCRSQSGSIEKGLLNLKEDVDKFSETFDMFCLQYHSQVMGAVQRLEGDANLQKEFEALRPVSGTAAESPDPRKAALKLEEWKKLIPALAEHLGVIKEEMSDVKSILESNSGQMEMLVQQGLGVAGSTSHQLF